MEEIKEQITNTFLHRYIKTLAAMCVNRTAGNYTKAYETWKRNHNILTYFQKLIKKKGKNIDILDIGCGNGYHLFALHSRFDLSNSRLTGIDMDELDLVYAEKIKEELSIQNVQFQQADATNINLPNDSYDLILCSEVLEHIPHPEECIAEIQRLLKPDGVAVITTPNDDNFMKKIGYILKLRFLRKKVIPKPPEPGGHISVKGIREWKRIIKAHDLTIEKCIRGSLIWGGGDQYNRNRILFALVLIVDKIFDYIPFTMNICENFALQIRKRGIDE